MDSKIWLLVAVFLTGTAISNAQVRCTSPSSLRRRVFQGYDRLVRPNYGGTRVSIDHRLYIVAIPSIDSENGKVTFDVYEDVYWVDNRLTWRRGAFCDVPELRVTRDDVWLPQLSAYYGVNNPNNKVENTLIGIFDSGSLGYSSHRLITTNCDVPSPIANQEFSCTITIGSWNYNENDLTFDPVEITESEFQDTGNPIVSLVGTASRVFTKKFECCVDGFRAIEYTITLRGKP